MTRTRHGFTLIELMIVVAIIAIIAAIAIPNLLRSRMAANETSAVANLRSIASAEIGFQTTTTLDLDSNGIGEFGTLVALTNAAWLDEHLGGGQASGYNYQITLAGALPLDEIQWEATAWPIAFALSGRRSFYVDEDGVVRGSDVGGIPAPRALGSTFPPIGN